MIELCFLAIMCAAALMVIVWYLIWLCIKQQEEINSWRDWTGAHMIYEMEQGITLLEANRMGEYFRRARRYRLRMKKERKGAKK